MSDTQSMPNASAPAQPRAGLGSLRRLGRIFGFLPAVVALAGLAGIVLAGQQAGWKVPKLSALRGEAAREPDDWCKEHGVPESICVECNPDLLRRPPSIGWCKEFGVHDCPFDNPAIAQLPRRVAVSTEDIDRARRALAFSPRLPNGKTCRQHLRRIQLASDEVAARLGIELKTVATAPVVEGITAPGEIVYNPSRIARLAPRLSGVVWRVEKRVGDRVQAGDILAFVEASEVGKAKAEFQQARTQVGLKAQTLAQKQALSGATVSGQEVLQAEADLEEARVRLLLAEQVLANLGMPLRVDEFKGLTPTEIAARMQFHGIPESLRATLAKETNSSNLLPVRSPLEGEVVAVSAARNQAAEPGKPLFVIADTNRMWLTLRVRSEDADRVKPGQAVRFRYAEQSGTPGGMVEGNVTWVSPAADEKTRTVPVRVELAKADGYRANTFGTAFIVLREEKNAVVVPSEAVHWEGCCNVVFVADRQFDDPGGFKVFHVRKVRPGAKDTNPAAVPVTEVIAGVLPGERVAVANSGVLRSELLKNDLGAG